MVPDDNKHCSAHVHSLGILFLLVAAFFAPLALKGHVLAGGDLVNQYVPYKYFWTTWLERGSFPLWNPLIFCGRPYLADIQLGLFYPPNWLHVLIHPKIAFTLLTFLHFLVACAGCYLFLIRILRVSQAAAVLGSIFFVFSGFFLTRLYVGIVLFIYAAAWTPWILYAFFRWMNTVRFRFAAFTALFTALQLVAGAPQVSLLTGYTVAVFFVVYLALDFTTLRTKKQLLAFVAGSIAIPILAAGLCAVQLLPTIEFSTLSFERAGKTAWDYVTVDSLEPRNILTWLFPMLYHDPTNPKLSWGDLTGYWEINAYMAIPAVVLFGMLVLFLFSRDTRRLIVTRGDNVLTRKCILWGACIIIVAGICMAFGKSSPLYWLGYHLLPGVDKFRVPARWIFLYLIGVIPLAALSFDTVTSREYTLRRIVIVAAIALLFLSIISGVVLIAILEPLLNSLGLEKTFNSLPPNIKQEVIADCILKAKTSIMTSLLVGILSLALVLLFVLERLNRATFVVLFALICILDVFMFGKTFPQTTPAKTFKKLNYPRTRLVTLMEQNLEAPRYRFLALDNVHAWMNDQNQKEIYPNRAMMHNLPDARGYDPLFIRAFGEYMNTLAGRPVDKSPGALLRVSTPAHPSMLDFINVKLLLTYAESTLPHFSLSWKAPFGLKIYENRQAPGQAFISRAHYFEGSKMQLLQAIARLENTTTVYSDTPVPPDFSRTKESTPPDGSLTLEEYSPDRRTYTADVNAGNVLVFSENYYPGWRVRVDGEQRPLIKINHTLSGVYISPGTHTVTKYFKPLTFTIGAVISVISLLVFCTIAFILPRARKNIPPAHNN